MERPIVLWRPDVSGVAARRSAGDHLKVGPRQEWAGGFLEPSPFRGTFQNLILTV